MGLKEWLNTDLFEWLFNKRKELKTIKIQASSPEGYNDNIILESMLTGRRINTTVPGTINAYTSYETQTDELYRKYNGVSDFGCQQTRAVIDLRTAFIAGEGISISSDNEQFLKWSEQFIDDNKLNSVNFINGVKGSEMAGQTIYVFKSLLEDNELKVKTNRIPYSTTYKYKPLYIDEKLRDKIKDIVYKSEFGWKSFGYKNFVYIRTGGDDSNSHGPVTRTGVVLTDLENYDRALKDIRRNNHIFARITPNWKTKSLSETTLLKKDLTAKRWKIGEAVIGEAEFDYKTPKTGAHENLVSEVTVTIKSISSTTGVPVHWLGFVDLMSNRATAQSLYESIKNATILERTIWQDSLHELILKAQEFFIDNGGTGLSYTKNFQVKLPLISFEHFLEIVRALNIAYKDEAISIGDYRNSLPGINPQKTAKEIKKEKEAAEKEFLATPNYNNLFKGDEGNEEDSDNK
ncbi:MAG: hypothetical protein P8Y70_00040 [Candidatus Lokiarchaeota archaeon]